MRGQISDALLYRDARADNKGYIEAREVRGRTLNLCMRGSVSPENREIRSESSSATKTALDIATADERNGRGIGSWRADTPVKRPPQSFCLVKSAVSCSPAVFLSGATLERVEWGATDSHNDGEFDGWSKGRR